MTTTSSGIDSPSVAKREAETVVDAKDGELIILAGLDESKEQATRSGPAFLPDFLHGRTNTQGRSQLLLLLEVKKVI